jgi:hypothetical protein
MGKVIYSASFPREGLPDSWEARGYYGSGNVCGLIDSLEGRTALVVGSGGTTDEIFEQYASARAASPDCVVFAVNDVGVYLPHVDHLVGLHQDLLIHWAALRKDKHDRKGFKTHSLYDADYNWEGLVPVMPISGYFAMQCAWIMGAARIILIGCPGDGTRRFFDQKARDDFHYQEKGVKQMVETEMRRLPEFKAVVRSFSGYTRDLFGPPELISATSKPSSDEPDQKENDIHGQS